MATNIDINGFEVQIYESIYDYASRNASLSDFADEDVDESVFEEKDEESRFPKVLVRPIFLYEDLNFSVGEQVFDGIEFPETVEIDGVEYTQVNFGEL
jgi:hypothetical protein